MELDFTPFFNKYKELSKMADSVFEQISKKYPECIKCKEKCSDCCNALFDLSLIEALYINYHFNIIFKGKEKDRLIEKANSADREIHKIKKLAYKDLEAGKDENEILAQIAEKRVRCPFLNKNDMCVLYDYRPITCRLYGIPTSIGGVGHTCGISGFVEGKQYSTVNLDIIHRKLYEISAEFVKAIKSKYIKMADLLVPLSMALLTEYNDEFLGIKQTDSEKLEK